MSDFELSPQNISQFKKDGYFVAKGLFDFEEISILRSAIEGDSNLNETLYNRYDANGRKTLMATWNHP